MTTGNYELKIITSAEDRGASGLLSSLGSGLNGVLTVAGGIIASQVFQKITSAIVDMGKAGFDAVSNIESTTLQLQTMVAAELRSTNATLDMSTAFEMSGDKASELLQWTRQLAKLSPFDTTSIQSAFTQAMSFGLVTDEAKKLTESMVLLGSANPKAPVEELIFYAAQMQATGKVTQMDLNQLSSRGVKLESLAQSLGVTYDSLKDLQPKELLAGLETWINNEYSGSIERASKTWSGFMGFISDTKTEALQTVFTKMYDGLRPLATKITEVLSTPQWTSFLDKIGTLLGGVGDKLGAFGIKVIDWILAGASFKDLLSQLPAPLQEFISIIGDRIGSFVNLVSSIFTQIKLIFTHPIIQESISKISAVFVELYSIFAKVEVGINSFAATMLSKMNMGAISNGIRDFADWFVTAWNNIKEIFAQVWENIQPKIQQLVAAFQTAWTMLQPAFASLKEAFGKLFGGDSSKQMGEYVDYLSIAFKTIIDVLTVVIGIVSAVIVAIIDGVTTLMGWLKPIFDDIMGLFTGIWNVISGVVNLIIGIFTGDGERIKEALTSLVTGLWQIISNGFNLIADVVMAVLNTVINTVVGFVKGIINFFKGLADELVGHSIIPDMMKMILDTFVNKFKEIYEFIKGIINSIIDFFAGIVTDFINVGVNIITGLWDGMKQAWNNVSSWVSDTLQNLTDGAKKLLGINSPSKIFMEIGQNVSLGLGEGIAKFMSVPQLAMANGISNMTDTSYASATTEVSAGSYARTSSASNQPIHIHYSPQYSFATDAELQRNLLPLVKKALRAA